MIDSITGQRITIYSEDSAPPYLMVPEEQLEQITDALKAHSVPYWVDEDMISVDDEPFVAIINLGREIDVQSVQRLLDSV